MLRVLWSKVRSIGDKILEVLRVLAVFGLHVLRNTARTRIISIFCTADTAILGVFRGPILRVLLALAVFGPSVLLILQVLRAFRPPVLQYSQYSEYAMYSILGVFLECEVY